MITLFKLLLELFVIIATYRYFTNLKVRESFHTFVNNVLEIFW